VLAVLLGSALTPGGLFGGAGRFFTRSVAGRVQSPDPLGIRLTKVYDSKISARVYGSEISQVEDQGFNASGQMTSDLSPVPVGSFAAPVASYLRYAAGWLRHVSEDNVALGAALRSGNRGAAQADWVQTWGDYLHLGAVYGLFGALDQQIDGMPSGLTGGISSPRFSGLHRIELGLWTGQPTRSLARWSRLLGVDVARLQRVLPHTAISPLNYATRAHEILEDAQRDLLSGMDVQWSGEGVLGTAAGLAATDEVIHTLLRLLNGRENTLAEVQDELLLLGQALDKVRREHHGSWPTLSELTIAQRDLLNGTLAGALGALELVPGTLETTPIPVIPSIPAGR